MDIPQGRVKRVLPLAQRVFENILMETVCAMLNLCNFSSRSADARDDNFVTKCSQLQFLL